MAEQALSARKRYESAKRKINVKMSDPETLELVKLIATYEAGRRGCAQGRALYELVMEAADIDSYPAEIRERFAEIDEQTRLLAVAAALAVE